jgi:hypothetical protein
MTALELREAELATFNEANPDFALTDDVIANDVPPRLTNQLKNGDITFKDFLEKAKHFVTTPKKIKIDNRVENQPDFANQRGSSTPSDEAFKQQSASDYTQEIF